MQQPLGEALCRLAHVSMLRGEQRQRADAGQGLGQCLHEASLSDVVFQQLRPAQDDTLSRQGGMQE